MGKLWAHDSFTKILVMPKIWWGRRGLKPNVPRMPSGTVAVAGADGYSELLAE
jgi:hypothetical protein